MSKVDGTDQAAKRLGGRLAGRGRIWRVVAVRCSAVLAQDTPAHSPLTPSSHRRCTVSPEDRSSISRGSSAERTRPASLVHAARGQKSRSPTKRVACERLQSSTGAAELHSSPEQADGIEVDGGCSHRRSLSHDRLSAETQSHSNFPASPRVVPRGRLRSAVKVRGERRGWYAHPPRAGAQRRAVQRRGQAVPGCSSLVPGCSRLF